MSASAHEHRRGAIDRLTEAIISLRREHPVRVAIDGRSAAGKSTLADELADAVQARGREIFRASIDDFHRPGHKHRSRQGGWTPRSYYDEGYDYEAFLELVLRPLGPGGSRRSRPAFFDSLRDTWFPERWQTVDDQAVALIDGVFLLRPEFVEHWDFVIWLNIDMETMVERARRRDVAWVGSAEAVERRYRTHWIPTHELYERLTDAPAQAHVVIDNRDPAEPRLIRFPLV